MFPASGSDPPSLGTGLFSITSQKSPRLRAHAHFINVSRRHPAICCSCAQGGRTLPFINAFVERRCKRGGYNDFPPHAIPGDHLPIVARHHDSDSVKDEVGSRPSPSSPRPFSVWPALAATLTSIKPPVPLAVEGFKAADVDCDAGKDDYSGQVSLTVLQPRHSFSSGSRSQSGMPGGDVVPEQRITLSLTLMFLTISALALAPALPSLGIWMFCSFESVPRSNVLNLGRTACLVH